MTEVQNRTAGSHNSRRAPVPHSEAVQEAKRREKMQTASSSHRVSSTDQRQTASTRDVAP
jgi:hypothetical protein